MIAIDTNQIANSFYCRSYKDKLNRITDDFLRSSTRRGEKFKAIESEYMIVIMQNSQAYCGRRIITKHEARELWRSN